MTDDQAWREYSEHLRPERRTAEMRATFLCGYRAGMHDDSRPPGSPPEAKHPNPNNCICYQI
jgi:hypothetical protein